MTNPSPAGNIDVAALSRWRHILGQAIAPSSVIPAAVADEPHALPEWGRSNSARSSALVCLDALHGLAGITSIGPVGSGDHAILSSLPVPAVRGSEVVAAVWSAYFAASRGDEAAIAVLDQATAALAPTALVATPDDNPEPWWAAELMILHPLRSHAWRHPSAASEAGIARCIAFHLAEIQPDHATNEPWAVHAFAATTDGHLTSETMLHAAMVQGGGHLTPAARLVVADAVAAIDFALDAAMHG
jgi:hypothetical protein